MSSMKPRKKVERIGPSFLHPDWTQSEVSLMVEIWRQLETGVAAYRINSQELVGGIDERIAALLARQITTTRSPGSIGNQRAILYKAVRFISRFDEFQQESENRSWFDLTKEEQGRVEIPTRERKACMNLTRESFNKLVKLKSVKKWANSHNVALPKPKTVVVNRETRNLSSCNSWSTADVRVLVRSWSLVMQKSNTLVKDFVTQEYDQSAMLYTPCHHSTKTAWQKMKRLAASYLFIRDFSAQNAPAQWFTLSNGARNDRSALPADFEDIPRAIFDELRAVDDFLQSDKSRNSVAKSWDFKVSSPLPDNCSSSTESTEEYTTNCSLSPPSPRPKKSPQFPDSSLTKVDNNPKRTTSQHEECNVLCEDMEQLQKKQLKQGITRLRTDIERDIRISADMIRPIFFEHFGDPGQNGDATFIANALEGQQRRIHEHFVKFQRDQCSDYVFGNL
ncbi:hypothetical protein PR003_g5373 [Phytophthora rubi]|uniref:Uncharacterized protein n=1 Tax=Phytophthora rubi TaxID=129364 RepID=A0A6A4G383_9STRA|nr:hypothetical protein PR003_g5373 [Phytophthora rubi]